MRFFPLAVLLLFASPASAEPVTLPPFQDEGGTAHAIEEFKGRRVVLNLWATWCAPCVKELPALDRLKKELADKNVEVVTVSLDKKDGAMLRQFFVDKGIANLTLYRDPSGAFIKALGAGGLPLTLLVLEDGSEAARFNGVADWDSAEVREALTGSAENLKQAFSR